MSHGKEAHASSLTMSRWHSRHHVVTYNFSGSILYDPSKASLPVVADQRCSLSLKRGTIYDDMLKLLFRVTQDDIHNVLLLSIVPLLVLLCTVQPSCSTLILAYTTQCAA